MSFVKLGPGNISSNSIQLHPKRSFVTSSMGTTGALKVIVNRSETQKDSVDMRAGLTGTNDPQTFSENTFEGRRGRIFDLLNDGTIDSRGDLALGILLDGTNNPGVNQIPEFEKYGIQAAFSGEVHSGYSDIEMHPRNSTELSIRNLKPGSSFYTTGSRALQLAERILEKEYSVSNSRLGSKYTNYNCLNLFSTDYKSALVYKNDADVYNTSDDFTIEFYVKINHTTGSNTVMHLPGDFCVSIISGSEVNENGYPTNYALASQHGVSASLASGSNRPDAIASFDTDSHASFQGGFAKQSNFDLKPEYWHNCSIRYNNSFKTLEYVIDGNTAGVHQLNYSPTKTPGRDLIMGAFFSGTSSDLTLLAKSYEQNTGGAVPTESGAGGTTGTGSPDGELNNFANINVHEIKIWNKYLSKSQIMTGSRNGYTGSATELTNLGLKLYIPCLYDASMIMNQTSVLAAKLSVTNQSSSSDDSSSMYLSGTQVSAHRDFVATQGQLNPATTSLADLFDGKATAYAKIYRTPYNTNHSSIGGFANMNIQNFCKEYVNTVFPFAHNMSESLYRTNDRVTVHELSSSFSSKPQHQKRNCFVLPCDNGLFRPGYGVLTNITGSKYIIENGESINTKDIGNLNDIYDSRMFFIDEAFTVGDSFIEPTFGTTDTQGGDTRYNAGVALFTTAEATPDVEGDIPKFNIPSGEDIKTFFDASDFVGNLVNVITIPQLYYGDSIKRKSIEIKSFLHTDSKSQIILRDDGEGNLYRHQTSGSVATWNSVGDVYYNEGLIYVRNPSLYAIGDQNLDISFEGVHNIYSQEINVMAHEHLVNSSSNPNYNKLKPSSNENETADDFVYISTIYLHDDNLNVIGKAKFAQPIVKRSENKFLFRLRVDY
jgi:hypothetical protein